MGRSVRGGPGAWAGRAIAGAARRTVGRWPRRCGRRFCVAAGASALGPQEAAGDPGEREPRTGVAGGEHDGRLLRREGLSPPRRRLRYVVPLTQPLAAARAPNDVWTADFKGWFRTADGTRCDPLTVADACSRFVLCCRIVAPERARGSGRGLSGRFGSTGCRGRCGRTTGRRLRRRAPGQLSRLAVWWLKLGIQLDRIDPGHPEQNGRHERFHLTLQTGDDHAAGGDGAAAATAVRSDASANSRRSGPHEALDQTPPARIMCPRPGPTPRGSRTRGMTRRTRCGACKRDRADQMAAASWCLSAKRCAGEIVGLAETERGDWTVRFMHVELGRIDRQTRRFTPAWHGRRLG